MGSATENRRLALVHATFYASTEEIPPAPTGDLIIPIGSLANNSGAQVFSPPSLTVNLHLRSSSPDSHTLWNRFQ